MAVDWKTVRQTETGEWEVQDINGEDWYLTTHCGVESPGHLICDLQAKNGRLLRTLKALRNQLAKDPTYLALLEADAALEHEA